MKDTIVLDPIELERKAREAKELLDNALLKEVFETIKQDYRREWENSSPGDIETQTECHRMIRVVDKVNAQLKSIMNGPKFFEFNNRSKMRL